MRTVFWAGDYYSFECQYPKEIFSILQDSFKSLSIPFICGIDSKLPARFPIDQNFELVVFISKHQFLYYLISHHVLLSGLEFPRSFEFISALLSLPNQLNLLMNYRTCLTPDHTKNKLWTQSHSDSPDAGLTLYEHPTAECRFMGPDQQHLSCKHKKVLLYRKILKKGIFLFINPIFIA